mmetsp:Transcript_2468/g.7258  ORF Transcript_2468/g.7258 Transcript_2468/m.7258 type:complete len:203 (+) Transcript_2468:510-1118(+)
MRRERAYGRRRWKPISGRRPHKVVAGDPVPVLVVYMRGTVCALGHLADTTGSRHRIPRSGQSIVEASSLRNHGLRGPCDWAPRRDSDLSGMMIYQTRANGSCLRLHWEGLRFAIRAARRLGLKLLQEGLHIENCPSTNIRDLVLQFRPQPFHTRRQFHPHLGLCARLLAQVHNLRLQFDTQGVDARCQLNPQFRVKPTNACR